MNLADYLSDLLAQHNEVSVPGLGCFARERISAYYNDKEAKFYPPYHRAKFIPQTKDDDTFTQYVADKKNISLASSKYFTEKFINKLKEDAAKGTYLFAGLGSFHTDGGRLVFNPNDKIADDPSFYGFPPVTIGKVGLSLLTEHTEHVFAECKTYAVITDPPVVIDPPVEITEQEQDVEENFEELPERKKRVSIWLILLIIITTAAVALFAVYEFFPNTFDDLNDQYHQLIGDKAAVIPVVKHKAKRNTVKIAAKIPDTPSSQAANAGDTVNALHWAIILETYKKLPTATAVVVRYKEKGIDAIVLPDSTGKHFRVVAGTYKTKAEAEVAMAQLINDHKIGKNSYSIEIKPQK